MDSPNGLKYARARASHVHKARHDTARRRTSGGTESGAKEKLVFIKLLRCMFVCVCLGALPDPASTHTCILISRMGGVTLEVGGIMWGVGGAF